MKQLVKRLFYRCAPELATEFFSARSRAHSHRLLKQWGCLEVNRALYEHLGDVVQEGPFQGLRLTTLTRSEQWGPYLLGTYESELDSAWEAVFTGSYRQIIDIGAKFGYYAVGLAKRFPSTDVIAFDTDPWARRAVREMAKANTTSNVRIHGFCSSNWLQQHVQEPAFVISDCEGYEFQLFSAAVIGKLTQSTLLIETHDCLVPDVLRTLRNLFASTHRIHTIESSRNKRTSNRSLSFLTPEQLPLATREIRPDQQWLLCLPNEGPNSRLKFSC